MFTRGDLVEGSTGSDIPVDLKDAITLLRVHRERLALPCPDAADFNDNGVLDPWDFNRMGEAIVEGTVPPAPYRRPSWDPTFDELPCDLPGASIILAPPSNTRMPGWRNW